MIYQVLNMNTVVDYIRNTPRLFDYFDKNEVNVQEIGDGNLNFVFLITSSINPHKQLILKQSIPYLRCAGESFPLEKERIYFECSAFRHFFKHSSQHIPMIYHVDEPMCLFVMQYFASHCVMRQGMIQGIEYPKFADHLSTVLAENLFKTSSFYLNSIEKNQLIAEFNGNTLRQLTENFVFTFPYMEHVTNKIRPSLYARAENLWCDFEFKSQILVLKNLFMNKSDALLHGDLHTGSILINQNETIVIDPEFAYVGPFGFDIGTLFANLIMSWVSHVVVKPVENHYAAWILNTIQCFWTFFEKKFIHLWNQHHDTSIIPEHFFLAPDLLRYQYQWMQNLLQESIGFAGCEIARRQWGIAGVEDIRGIQDEETAFHAETLAIVIARELVVNYRHYRTVHQMLDTIQQCFERHTMSGAEL